MSRPNGEKARGWWRFEAVDPGRRFGVEDGFADEEGRPDDAMPTMWMVFSGHASRGKTARTASLHTDIYRSTADMRRRRYVPEAGKGWDRGATELDCEDASTPLHEERLDVVTRVLVDSGAVSVLDLGCGSGTLLRRLLGEPQFTRIVGIDSSLAALRHAERLRDSGAGDEPDRLSILHGSFTTSTEGLTGFDAVALVETIEHVPPAELSKVEQVVFSEMRPSLVVLTTPNREYNELYGLEPGELRHPDHRFEWDRARFGSWAAGVGARNGYQVQVEPIGPANAWHGGPSQMAIFRRVEGV